jgi:hypothetical protein
MTYPRATSAFVAQENVPTVAIRATAAMSTRRNSSYPTVRKRVSYARATDIAASHSTGKVALSAM